MSACPQIQVMSKTRWFTMSVAQVRVCLYCGKVFDSTSPGERQCHACAKAQDGARARAAVPVATTELKEFLDGIFDIGVWDKMHWSQLWDTRNRARRKQEAGMITEEECAVISRRCRQLGLTY
jgi:hypothetical protein